MPNLQDIERFKQDIRTLGKEPELLDQWGEPYEDVPPPEQGVPSDLSDLMKPAQEEYAQADEEIGDLSSFLDNLSLEPLPGMEEPESPLGAGLEAPEEFSLPKDAAAVDALGKTPPDFEGLDESVSKPGLADASERPVFEVPLEEGAVPEALLQGLVGDLESSESQTREPSMEDLISGAQTPGLTDDLSAFEIQEVPPEAPGKPAAPEGEPLEEPAAFGEIPLGQEELSLLGNEEPEVLEQIPVGADAAHEPSGESFGDFDFSIPELGDSGEIPAESAAEPTPPEPEVGEAPAPSEPEPEDIPEAGAPQSPFDTFDSFRLDDGTPPGLEGSPGKTGGPSLDEELASLENDLTPSENFNLESAWGGADFSIPGYETPSPAPGKPLPKVPAGRAAGGPRPEQAFPSPREPEFEEGMPSEVALSDGEVDALQDTLLSYPLNLRLAVEEALAEERGTEAQRAQLVNLLAKGGTPGDAANLVSRILKRPIFVPKDFEKRSGAELEAERASLPYILVHTVAPIAAIVLAVVLGLGVVGFLGYHFIYRPIRAELVYRRGYEEIRQDRFPEAEDTFNKAARVWVHKRWYYRYADAFTAKNQFVSAARRYDDLLRRWPNDRKGVLDYANMEFQYRLDYPKAAKLLKDFIEARNYYDKDALLLLGDVYLEWAESEGDKGAGLFEDSRLQYSTLVDHYGPEDLYMERMLRWFLRTDRTLGVDNSKQILELKDRFISNPKSRVSPRTLADLGGYLLDNNEMEDVSRILLRASKADPSLPEAHYELSRYYRRIDNAQEERRALANTVRLLESVENPTNRRIGMLVEALIRGGEGYAEIREYVTAEEMYTKAVQRYERALSLGQLKRSSLYGKAYADLADILFFQRNDLDGALLLYEKAQGNGYLTPQTQYKQGYIQYRRENWEAALESFYKAGLDLEESPYLLYSTGNALFQREDYFAAQGYYSRLVERLRFEMEQLPLVEPQVRPSHGEIVDLLMRATNNLGVALYRIGNRMGDARRRAGAMAQFTESSRFYDSLERDPKTMIRPETKNLGYLNLDFVLHPQRGIDLSIYPDLSKDMKFPKDL